MAESEKADPAAEGAAGRAKASLPSNVANIRFLLIDGRTSEMQFPTSARVGTIKQELYKAWPAGASSGWAAFVVRGGLGFVLMRAGLFIVLGKACRVGRRQGLDVAAGAAAPPWPLPGGHLHSSK